MDKIFFFLLMFLYLLIGCSKKDKAEEQINALDYPVSWYRFDIDFSTLSSENFDELHKKYPFLLHQNVSAEQWIEKSKDSLFQELSEEVNRKYPDLQKLQEAVNPVLKRIHYYFPTQNPNKVITLISEVDVQNQVVYTDSLVLLSLDTYLGEKHKYYSVFDAYRLRNFNEERLPVDVAYTFANQVVGFSTNATLLDNMIDEGKKIAILDSLMPQLADTLKFNYTKSQLDWAKVNEEQIWRYFIENKYLYSNNPKLYQRFVQPAPFSKFYLSFDKESPGNIARFIGYHIVKSYQEQHQSQLKNLILKDNETLFKESKYKPQKQ